MEKIFKEITKKGKSFIIRSTDAAEIERVLMLQEEVCAVLEKKDWFVKITREEVTESTREDITLGAYDGERLVAFSLIVRNRSTERNLGEKYGFLATDCYCCDSAFVHPDYRGFGLQGEFLDIAREEAKKDGASSLWATVSPENIYSHRNCDVRGYTVFKSSVPLYGGKIRDVLVLEI